MVRRLVVGLAPAVVAVVGLNAIFGTAWPIAGKLGVAALWLAVVLVVAWFAMYRWGDEKQRRDVANARRRVGGLFARLSGRDPGDR